MNSPMDPPRQSGTVPYVLTEEEKQVIRECQRESFFYRSLPFSAFSMLITQLLIKKGIIVSHPKWGSIPKLTLAGMFGYFAGKISYMEKCKEKFGKLENSQLRELLWKQNRPELRSQQPRFSNVPSSSESVPAGELSRTSKYPVDNYGAIDFPSQDNPVPFSSSVGESSPSGITDGPPPEYVPPVEESAKRRITYEELRSKNREMYGAVMPKSDVLSKPSQERPFKQETKVNKYGDAWEE
uniref:OCIA domain-containing protein 1 n=1 Tax=Pogona vitticeps TaxID=103695 RepID=A0ABM5GI98_9SAUR|nr:OCIA domain-containing protein 1 [Pogona vitticeps]